MDVEIVKKNGKVFRLSDYGVVQDFVVSSIDKRTHRENIDGRPGAVNYGSYDGDRTITVPFIFKAHDLHDYVHLRDELYGLLDDGEPFYIREMRRTNYLQYEFVNFGEGHKWSPGTDNQYVNGKQILVRLDSVITPEQEFKNGNVVLEFISDELPYFESTYSTLELHDSGYSATAEKYGLVDNIDDEKVKYRFVPETDYQPNLIPLTQSAWEEGGWFTTNGEANDRSGRIRTKAQSPIEVIEGEAYTFRDDSVYTSAINNIYILHYRDGQYIGSTRGWELVKRRGSLTFNARGNEIRLSLLAMEGFSILLEFITNGRIQMKLEPGEDHTGYLPDSLTLTVYNAGNVTIEPEYSFLEIVVNDLHSSKGFTLTNRTTGDSFTLNRSSEGFNLGIRGMVVNLGGITNIFRDTNRRFISLDPGDNVFEITGGTFKDISINFKYLYK